MGHIYIKSCPLILLLGAICSLFGCSKTTGPHVVEVRGKVTYRGQPVPHGGIIFTPTSGSRGNLLRPATGQIAPDGSYELQAFPGRKGAVPGEYSVSVRSYTGSIFERTAKYVVPAKFADAATSGLRVTIPDQDKPHQADFDL